MRRHLPALALSALLATAARSQPAASADAVAADVANLAPRLSPSNPEADPRFWAVVKHGKAAVPALLARLDDATPTAHEVPLVGGRFAQGDVAFEALKEIVDLPWQELVPRTVKAKVHGDGLGAYYGYVRASEANRKQLAAAVRKWWSANEAKLVFFEMPGHPAGGWWQLPVPVEGMPKG